MRTITVTEKYRAVNEGKMAKSEFVRQMRQSYPMYVSSVSDFNSTVQILKNRNMLFEEKTEVDDSFKYSTDSLRRAIDIELEAAGLMSHEKVSGEDQEKARVKAVANLKKDPLHYYHLISGDSSKVDKHDKTVEVKKGNEVDTFNGLKKAELKEDKENLKEGTRALVGYLSGDRLTTTYNHYDGYPSGLGQGLMTHYNNDDLAKDIAMKGYITSMDPASGEISATHSDPAKKITLDDDAEERAREIAGEIDGMGADYGYIWDDESNQWITIKNTGIRSMIDQMMDKLSMMNVYSGDKMNEADPIPTEPGIPGQRASNHNRKMALRKVIDTLTKDGHPEKGYKVSNDEALSFIRTYRDEIFNGTVDFNNAEAIWDEYEESESIDRDSVDEKKVTEEEEENWREEYPEAKNSWEYDDQGYGALEAFFDDVVHKVGPEISLEDAKGLLDKRGEGGDDTKAFNQAVITQMQATDDDDMDRKSTQNMIQAYEEKYNEPFSTSLIKHLDSLVYEKKGTDHDGDGDIDGDDYMAAKDKAIKKAMGKEVSEADRDEESMVHELIGDLFAPGNARSHLDFSVKEIARNLKRYGDHLTRQGVKDAMDLYDKLAADGTLDKEVEDGDGFVSSYHVPKLKKAFELIGLYGKNKDEAIKKAMGKEVDEAAGDDEDLVHELIGDLFAPGNARLHFEMPIKTIASYLKKYRGSITRQAVKDAMDTYDKLAADGTLQKDYDNDNGFLLPEHILILKKAFGLIGLYGKDMNESVVRKNLKSIITKVLEEEVINEAATNVLAAFGDDYAGFDGMKSAINQLENIVTDIEQYYDKTRTKIQKIYDTLGEIRNEEGLKVGGFLAPAVEQAFNRDLRPVIKMGFTKGLDQPQVKKLASPGMAQETEAPKATVFTPVQENKKQ